MDEVCARVYVSNKRQDPKKPRIIVHRAEEYIPRNASDKKIEGLEFLGCDWHIFEDMRHIIGEYLRLDAQLKVYGSDYSEKQLAMYREAIEKIDNAKLSKVLSESDGYLTDTARTLFDSEIEITRDELAEKLIGLFKTHPEYFAGVINALSTASEPTILDGIFNPGRLRLARNFNSFNPDEVLENRKVVNAMLENYENVKAWNVV